MRLERAQGCEACDSVLDGLLRLCFQCRPVQKQVHFHLGPRKSSPCPLSLCSSTFTVCAATNFLMQPSQTARMEAWQQCAESAITLAAPTQPQEDTRPTALAMAKALRARVRQVWRLPWDNITGRKFGGAYSSMVWWEQGATDGP